MKIQPKFTFIAKTEEQRRRYIALCSLKFTWGSGSRLSSMILFDIRVARNDRNEVELFFPNTQFEKIDDVAFFFNNNLLKEAKQVIKAHLVRKDLFKPSADKIARMADKGVDISKHFTKKGKLMPAIHRV